MTRFTFLSSHVRDASPEKNIVNECDILAEMKNCGQLGHAIAVHVLTYSPRDLIEMKLNFSEKIRDYSPDLRKHLEETITVHLNGTYQQIRLMNQEGLFSSMKENLSVDAHAYWKMVAFQCSTGDEHRDYIRFLKFLLSGFCMLVQKIPGHPVGMPFPGGDKVDCIDGIYYCPVRLKTSDVDAALCPFCPAEQIPEIGYLKPPVNASDHRKQEFIKNCYEYHHFNG